MVATLAALTSSAQASSYYEADDYYAEGGQSPSQWQGKGAEALGLSGEVDRDQFRALLDGRIGDQQLGRSYHHAEPGQVQHRPGWDVTLSAPKSVSIMAEVAGDRRLIAAHDAAVTTALAHIERHMAATRVREGNSVTRQATDNLVIAIFQHGMSRSQDPQLHTHNVIMNATMGEDGTWRSLEPRAIYQLQKQIGAIYRQELAARVCALGYQIEAGKDSLFELKHVPEPVMTAFSKRSAQIDAALAERGSSRETASALERQIATLDTRQAKQTVTDHAALIASWREAASDAGFGRRARQALIERAEERVASLDRKADQATQMTMATRAVHQAAERLGERQSVFSEAALHEQAGRIALGKASHALIGAAIAAKTEQGELAGRVFVDRRGAEFAGFATRRNIEAETAMLRIEEQGRNALAPIASPLAAAKAVASAARQAERVGYAWNDAQRRATEQLLASRDRITALQGYAGTAKTTTVLASFARTAEGQGATIIALAPTASAAMVLGQALDARSDTVARHLLAPERSARSENAIWIVDEASLLSARDTARLFALAEQHQARIMLVGDVKQLGSIEAGAAFNQLQEAGMATARLDTIVRQSNAATKDAVLASIEGDARKALTALDQGGGRLVEHAERAERFAVIASQYASLDSETRARTLVIEPSREGRDALTADIRAALSRSDALTGPAVTMRSLANKGLSRAEARDPASYDIGDVVRFTRDYSDKGVRRGDAYRIESINLEKSAILLKSEDGREVDWRLRQWGASKVQAFTAQELELQSGDSIRFTRNDRQAGRVNGERGEVLSLDEQGRTATIRLENGRSETLQLDTGRDQHLAHAYVDTAFAAQGRTADHVLIHVDSRATNLIDQKTFYVAISRAKESATIVTDDRARLIAAIGERTGLRQSALSQKSTAADKINTSGLG